MVFPGIWFIFGCQNRGPYNREPVYLQNCPKLLYSLYYFCEASPSREVYAQECLRLIPLVGSTKYKKNTENIAELSDQRCFSA